MAVATSTGSFPVSSTLLESQSRGTRLGDTHQSASCRSTAAANIEQEQVKVPELRRSTSPVNSRPTRRRLKYLCKWGHSQLIAYRKAPAALRLAVLDEVVRAFSPWVQRIFLLNSRHGWAALDISAEQAEVTQHLAPLRSWLQRKSTLKVIAEGAELVGVAALVGAVEAKHVSLCHVVFTTILETAAFFDQSDVAIAPSLPEAMPATTSGERRISRSV